MNLKKSNTSQELPILRFTDSCKESVSDKVICEHRVAFFINDRPHKILYCLQENINALAMGHLVSEGLCRINNIDKIKVTHDEEDITIDASINDVDSVSQLAPVSYLFNITPDMIMDFVTSLENNSILFKKTGASHIVGIFYQQQSIFAEDISRHCAIDKAIGLALQNKLDLSQSTMVTSCRQTISTITKAIFCGIPVVCSVSAATSLAISYSERYCLTLIGFARGRRFNVYTHPERIQELTRKNSH